MISFICHPKDLANAIANAVSISKEKSVPKSASKPLTKAEILGTGLTPGEIQATMAARARPGGVLTVEEVGITVARRTSDRPLGPTEKLIVEQAADKTWALTEEEAVVIAQSRAKTRVTHCEHILLSYQSGASGPALYVYGVGRYAAGRSKVPLETGPDGSASVCIDRTSAETLAPMLRKVGTKKADTVFVTIYDEPTLINTTNEQGHPIQQWVSLVIANAVGPMAEMLDSDPEGNADSYWDAVDTWVAAPAQPGAESMTFTAEVVTRLKDIYTDGPAVDMRRTNHDQIVAVAMGSLFRGVLVGIGRDIYAEGGPWRNGPGSPDHLL